MMRIPHVHLLRTFHSILNAKSLFEFSLHPSLLMYLHVTKGEKGSGYSEEEEKNAYAESKVQEATIAYHFTIDQIGYSNQKS
jgi:hypothetical protein